MARDEIFAMSDYGIIDKNRRKTFLFLFKTDVNKKYTKPFGRNLIQLQLIAAKFLGSIFQNGCVENFRVAFQRSDWLAFARGACSSRHSRSMKQNFSPELSMDRNRNLFRQEYINFFETGAGMELFCGLPEQEFRLTV